MLNDDRLLELLAQILGKLAAEHIARPAGAEQGDDLDRAGRTVLRGSGAASAVRAVSARAGFENRAISHELRVCGKQGLCNADDPRMK
jgi:hypothetical protein